MAGLGRKVFQPGEVLTATNVQNYLMDQAVQVYADSAARGSAIGSATTEGMVSWLADTDQMQVALGTATWQDVSFINSENAILNGAFDVWQRGTSFTSPSIGTYTADRWNQNVPTNSVISRQTPSLTGFRFCARVQRPSGQTSTAIHYLSQSQEIAIGSSWASKTVTFSFYARAGSNYSAVNGALTAQVLTGTGATEINRMSATYTGEATPLTTTVTLTTSWQRFSVTGTLGSNISAFTTWFAFTPTGTASTNDYFEVTGVQFEAGVAPTPFRRNAPSIQAELAACQRYYFRKNAGTTYGVFGSGFASTTTLAYAFIPFPVEMRTSPSTTLDWTGTAGNYRVLFTNTSADLSATPTIDSNVTTTGVRVNATVPAALTAGQGIMLISTLAGGSYLGFSAEL